MESFLNDVKKKVQCSLCEDTLIEPKILKCFHTFCKPCIKRHAELIKEANVFKCPKCSSETFLAELNNVDDLHSNLLDSRILKGLALVESEKVCSVSESHSPASWYCFDCDHSLCLECRNYHSFFTKDHKLVRLADLNREDFEQIIARENHCKSHPSQTLELFCKDCDTMICLTCLKQAHRNHKTITLDEFASIKKALLSKHLQVLEHLRLDEKEKQEQQEIADKIIQEGEKAVKEVKDKTKDMIEILQENERELLKRIDEKLYSAKRNLNIIHHISAVKEYINNVMERGLASEMVYIQEKECPETFIFNSIPPYTKITFVPNEELMKQVNSGLGEIQTKRTNHEMRSIQVESKTSKENKLFSTTELLSREFEDCLRSSLSRTLEKGVVLSVHQGDITKENVDVIVNAANERLDHGGGVAGAIVRQGGQQIQQESDAWVRQYGYVSVGSVAWTNPGRLPCRRIFHAVGPQWRVHGEAGCRQLIFNACINSFNIASQQNMCSIAIPGISSGVYGVPVKICAEMMFTAAEQFSSEASNNNQLKDIRFVNTDTPTYEAFKREFYKLYGMKGASSIPRSQKTNLVTYPQEEDKGTGNERKFVSNQTNFSDRNGVLVREEPQASAEDSGISRAGVAALKRKEEEEKAKEMEGKKEEEEKEEEEKKKKREMAEKKKKQIQESKVKKEKEEEKKKEKEKKAKASQNNMHQPILKESSNQQSATPFEGGFNRRQENTERYFEGTKSEDNKYKTNNVFLYQSTTSHEIDDTEEDDDSLSNKLTGMQIGEDPPAKERVGEKTLTNNNKVVTVDSDATLPRKDNSTDNLTNSTIFNNPTGNTSPAVAVNLSGRGLTYETKTDSSQTHNKSLKTVGRGRGALNLAANLSGKPGHAVRETGIDPTSEPPRNLSVSRNKIPPGLTVTEGGGEEEEKEDGGNNEEREKGEKKIERDGGKEERRHAVRGTGLDLTSEPERNLSDGGNKIPPGLTVTEEGLKLAKTNRGERENERISQEKKIKKKHIEVGFAGQEKDEVPSKKFKADNFTDVMEDELKKPYEALEKENHDKLVISFGETSEAKDEGDSKEEKESLRTAARSETDRRDRPRGEEKKAEKIPETERNREEKDDQLESSNIDGSELSNKMDGQQTDKEKNSVDLKIDEQKADSKERTGLRKNVDTEILDRSTLNDKKEKHEIPEQVSNNGHPSSETQNEEVPESDIPKKSMNSNEVPKDKSTEQSLLERQYSGFNHEGSEKNLDRKNNLDEASLDEPSSMLSNSFEMINMPSVGQENSIKVGENDGSNESSERIENPQSEEGRLSDSADSKEADRKELEMSNFQNDLERAEGTSDDKENLQEPLSMIKNSANGVPETGMSGPMSSQPRQSLR